MSQRDYRPIRNEEQRIADAPLPEDQLASALYEEVRAQAWDTEVVSLAFCRAVADGLRRRGYGKVTK